MRRSNIWVLVTLLVLVAVPAYAYGDPSGGTLFQILMPTLAAIWGMWMIFANRVSRGLSKLVRRLRGLESQEEPIEVAATAEENSPSV